MPLYGAKRLTPILYQIAILAYLSVLYYGLSVNSLIMADIFSFLYFVVCYTLPGRLINRVILADILLVQKSPIGRAKF